MPQQITTTPSTATTLAAARADLEAAEKAHAAAVAEERQHTVAVEAAHKAAAARAPDAAALLRLARERLDAATIARRAREQELQAAREALAVAERADQHAQLSVAIDAANRRQLFERLEPTIATFATVHRWELVPGAPLVSTSVGRVDAPPTMRPTEERPDLDMPYDEHVKALSAFVRDELVRGECTRAIVAALDAQHSACETVRTLAAKLGVSAPNSQPVHLLHVLALVALESAPRPLTREWVGAWRRNFAVEFPYPTMPHPEDADAFGAGVDTFEFAREAAISGDGRGAAAMMRSRREQRERQQFSASGVQAHPDAPAGDPRAVPNAQRPKGSAYPTRPLM